jgi:hypothetical protein
MAFKIFGGRGLGHPLATERGADEALAALPKGNADKALEELHDWIVSVGAAEGLKPERRAEILLMLDEAALPFHRKLTRDYVTDSNLSKEQEARLWRALSVFWKELAAAYSSGIEQCAADAAVAGRLKAQLPLICIRALRAFACQIKWQCMHYEPEGAETWKAIGKVYRHAEEKAIHGEMIRLYPNSSQTSSAEREFVKLLMFAASSPDSLSPRNIELAEWIVAHMGASFVFSAAHQPQLTYNYIDLDSGLPPKRLMQTLAPSPNLRFFAAGPAAGELDNVIRVLEGGAPPYAMNLGGAYDSAKVLSACLRLKAYWSAPPPVRKSDRYEVSHSLSVVTDFASIISLLQGGKPTAGPEVWVTENICAGGVAAVVSNVQGDALRVGRLVALSVAGGSGAYSVGVIRRWNRRPKLQSGVAIRTFAKAAFPVTFGGIASQDAILLNDDRNLGEEVLICLRVGGFDKRVPPILNFGNEEFLLVPLAIIESDEDFEVARYRVMRSADGGQP